MAKILERELRQMYKAHLESKIFIAKSTFIIGKSINNSQEQNTAPTYQLVLQFGDSARGIFGDLFGEEQRKI